MIGNIVLFVVLLSTVLAIREIICWYNKTNEILERLDNLQGLLEAQEKKIDRLNMIMENNNEINKN